MVSKSAAFLFHYFYFTFQRVSFLGDVKLSYKKRKVGGDEENWEDETPTQTQRKFASVAELTPFVWKISN